MEALGLGHFFAELIKTVIDDLGQFFVPYALRNGSVIRHIERAILLIVLRIFLQLIRKFPCGHIGLVIRVLLVRLFHTQVIVVVTDVVV